MSGEKVVSVVPPWSQDTLRCQGVLGFKFEPYGRYSGHPLGLSFVARPMKVFQPKGLALWGAPPGARLSAVINSVSHELLVSLDPVPARLFSGFASFEALKRQIEDDEAAFAGWGTFGTLYPGCELVLLLWGCTRDEAERIEVGMWGLTT